MSKKTDAPARVSPDWIDHPSADRTDRFPDDQKLRGYGWKILARPRNGQALWVRGFDGREMLQADALESVDAFEDEPALAR